MSAGPESTSIPGLFLSPPDRGPVAVWQHDPRQQEAIRDTDSTDGLARTSQSEAAENPDGVTPGEVMSPVDKATMDLDEATDQYRSVTRTLGYFLNGQANEYMGRKNVLDAITEANEARATELKEGIRVTEAKIEECTTKVEGAQEAANAKQTTFTATSTPPLQAMGELSTHVSQIMHNLAQGGSVTVGDTISNFESLAAKVEILRKGFERPDGTIKTLPQMATDSGLAFDENTTAHNTLRFEQDSLRAEEVVLEGQQEEISEHEAALIQEIERITQELQSEQYFTGIRDDEVTLLARLRTAWKSWRDYKKGVVKPVPAIRLTLQSDTEDNNNQINA